MRPRCLCPLNLTRIFSLLLCAPLLLWPHFSILSSKPAHHFSACLNPIHPSKENPSRVNFPGSYVPAASHLCSPYCIATTPQGCSIHTQSETKSPNRLSTKDGVRACGKESLQSLIASSFSSIHVCTCLLIHNRAPFCVYCPIMWVSVTQSHRRVYFLVYPAVLILFMTGSIKNWYLYGNS